jgi:gliding motility-associated-like protein
MYNGTTGMFTISAGCGDTSVILAFQHDIQCGSIVSTDVRASDPNGLPNPVLSATAINCQSGMTDSILITFLYPFTAGTTYLFTKVGNDGNTFLSQCGTQMPEFDSIAVVVIDSGIYVIPSQNVSCFFTQLTVNFPEQFTCGTIVSDASDFHFVDATGTNFPLVSVTSNCSSVNQYDFTNQLTFTFASGVIGTGPYYLIVDSGIDLNTVANKCGTFFQSGDTLAQLNVTNNIIVNLGPDITACASDPAPVIDAGNPGVTYTWYFNGVQISDTTQTILADSSGTYSVVCFYSGTCQGTDSINVTITPAPTPNIGPDASICIGDAPPVFTVNGVSGTATYQWYFNGFALAGDTLQTLTPDTSMGSGTYSVIVNTGGTCNGTDALLFTINPGLIPNVGVDQVICQNDPLTLTAGVVAASYQWFDQFGNIPGATGPSYQVNTGVAGTYTFGVIATGPCQGTDTMQLIINAIPTGINAGPDTSVCITDNYTLSVPTGFTYQWYNNGVLIAGATGSTYMPTTTGTYSVLATNGTCSATDSVNVTVYLQAPVPTVSNASYCSGGTVPTLDAGVTGVNYVWSNGATTQTTTPSGPGTYTITVTAGTCAASASATISQIATPQPALSNASRCADETTSLVLDPGINNPAYSYQWNDNAGNPIAGATNSTYTVPQPFTNTGYSVTIINTQNGVSCTGSASMTVSLNPSVTVDTISGVTICAGFSATFTANSPSSSPTYSWTGPNAFTANTQSFTITDAVVAATGTYTVTVTDVNGCTGTQTADLTVEPCDIVPHNVFTPNGDGNNDFFYITNITSYPSNNVKIYNRWGNKVYDESGYNNTSVKFEGTDLPDGTYYYIITAPEITKLVSGTVTKIKDANK